MIKPLPSFAEVVKFIHVVEDGQYPSKGTVTKSFTSKQYKYALHEHVRIFFF